MHIFTLASNDPQFSYILSKNPNTQATQGEVYKEVRKGRAYGWFSELHQYNMAFIDAPDEASYSNSEFEYLDSTRYTSPMSIYNMINSLLRSASRGVSKSPEGGLVVESGKFETTATFVVACRNGIRSGLTGIVTSMEELHPMTGYWKMTVTSNTVQMTLRRVQLICVLAQLKHQQHLNNANLLGLREEDISGHLKVLVECNAPFLAWHIYLSLAVQNKSSFLALQKNGEIPPNFRYGKAQVQRREAVLRGLKQVGDYGTALLEIGCGEGSQAKYLAKHFSEVHLIDSDPGVEDSLKKVTQNVTLSGIVCDYKIEEVTAENVWQYLIPNSTVLLTEVLEHMPRESSRDLLSTILRKAEGAGVKAVAITMPNGKFNKYFGIPDGEMRHPDHKWEPQGFDEFAEFVTEARKESSLSTGYLEFHSSSSMDGEAIFFTVTFSK